jgi:predicted RNA-binding Zn ribbon-like protein
VSWQFDLCGDHLALDFADTVSDRESGAPIERLPAFADLVSFARQTGILSADREAALLARAHREPQAATRAHGQAVALRDALYRLFAAVARDVPAERADVERLGIELGRLCIGPDLSLTWHDEPDALDGFMGAIVHAAVMLATTRAERDRVRICEAPDCEWLFYDLSRNRSRRWCDMRQCGNRMKARRHYARGKSAGA